MQGLQQLQNLISGPYGFILCTKWDSELQKQYGNNEFKTES